MKSILQLRLQVFFKHGGNRVCQPDFLWDISFGFPGGVLDVMAEEILRSSKDS